MATKAAVLAWLGLALICTPSLQVRPLTSSLPTPARVDQHQWAPEVEPAQLEGLLLERLGELVDEPVKQWMKNKLAGLIGQQPTRRQVELASRTVFSIDQLSERLNQDRMNVSFERQLEQHPEYKLVFAANETSVLVAKKVNIYFYWESPQTVASVMIFVMIIAGNSSVLRQLARVNNRRRSNVNYFIVNLAIADLCVGLFCVTGDFVQRLLRNYSLGLLACRTSKYISVLFIYSSTYMLVALSVDRWQAVVKPLALTKNPKRTHQLVYGVWFVAAFCAVPSAILAHIEEVDEVLQCKINLSKSGWKVYFSYITCTTLALPATLIAVFYVHIVYTIWSKAKLAVGQQRVSRRRARFSHRGSSTFAGIQTATTLASSSVAHLDEQVEEEQQQTGVTNSSITQVSCIHASELAEPPPLNEFKVHEDEPDTEDESVSSEVNSVEKVRALELTEFSLSNSKGSGSAESAQPDRELHNQAQQDLERNVEVTDGLVMAVGTRCSRRLLRQHGKGLIPKARIKTVKMTLVIVAAFILCWSPFCIINMLFVFDALKKDTSLKIALSTLTQSLAHLNSAVNPIIFWLFTGKNNSNTKRKQVRPMNNNLTATANTTPRPA